VRLLPRDTPRTERPHLPEGWCTFQYTVVNGGQGAVGVRTGRPQWHGPGQKQRYAANRAVSGG